MRNLFFALVLVNLAYAAWTAWYAERAPAGSTPRETGLPIRLVGEDGPSPGEGEDVVPNPGEAETARFTLAATEAAGGVPDAAGAAAAAVENDAGAGEAGVSVTVLDAAEPSSASADRCISVGPFTAVERAEAASSALESAGFAIASRSGDGEIWVGFWVHIDAIPTRDEANAMLARLRDNGLPDAYLIPGEEDGDIISLGVFNDMTRAGRLERQVRDIGLVPLIVERSRPGVVHWLDVSVPAGRELDLAGLGIRDARIGQAPCPSAG